MHIHRGHRARVSSTHSDLMELREFYEPVGDNTSGRRLWAPLPEEGFDAKWGWGQVLE